MIDEETDSGSHRDLFHIDIPIDDLLIKDFPFDISPRKAQSPTASSRKAHTSSEPALADFFCPCSLCTLQSKGKANFKLTHDQEKDDIATYEGKEKSFCWLLEQLGEATSQALIKINIPETIVYRKAKPKFMIQQGRDRALKFVTSAAKLKNPEIRKNFTFIVRQRKKDDSPTSPIKFYKGPSSPFIIDHRYGHEIVLVRYMLKDKENDISHIAAADEDGPLRVMFENEFVDLMYERPGSPIWKTISYIQTVIKCKAGISEPFIVTYYSHEANDREAILALQKAGQDDDEIAEEKLADSNVNEYCLFICRRIAYFLATYSQKEVLRIKAEFMKDDNGKVWFTYATKISVRDIAMNNRDKELLFKRVGLTNVQSKEKLNEELQKFQNEPPRLIHQTRMSKVMTCHYEEIKKEMGIDKLFEPEPQDKVSNDAFAKLRPMTPYSLQQLLDPTASRSIARKYLYSDNRVRTKKKNSSLTSTTKPTKSLHRQAASLSSLPTNQISWVYNPKVIQVNPPPLIRHRSRLSLNFQSWL